MEAVEIFTGILRIRAISDNHIFHLADRKPAWCIWRVDQ
jgi:hypothetical protein